MHDSSISMKVVSEMYREMEFLAYCSIDYQDQDDRIVKYIIVTGLHEELGRMTIRQSLLSADILCDDFMDPAEYEAFEAAIKRGESPDDAVVFFL